MIRYHGLAIQWRAFSPAPAIRRQLLIAAAIYYRQRCQQHIAAPPGDTRQGDALMLMRRATRYARAASHIRCHVIDDAAAAAMPPLPATPPRRRRRQPARCHMLMLPPLFDVDIY